MGRNGFVTRSPHYRSWEESMKTYFVLSAIGKDRPGIVADVSEVIYGCGGNIEDSSMSLLRNHFALLLLFSMEREGGNQTLASNLKRIEEEKNLTIFFSPVTFEEAYPTKKEETHCFKLTTSGVDHSGIVFKVCRLLADHRVNIIDMETRRLLSAESGTPIFEMDMEVEVPRAISEEGLRKDLHRLADELRIDLVLRKI